MELSNETMIISEAQSNEPIPPIANAVLVTALIVNIWISLMFRAALFNVTFMYMSSINMMMLIDESIKMIVLFGQSLMVYHFVLGDSLRQVYGPRCSILMYCSAIGQVWPLIQLNSFSFSRKSLI